MSLARSELPLLLPLVTLLLLLPLVSGNDCVWGKEVLSSVVILLPRVWVKDGGEKDEGDLDAIVPSVSRIGVNRSRSLRG